MRRTAQWALRRQRAALPPSPQRGGACHNIPGTPFTVPAVALTAGGNVTPSPSWQRLQCICRDVARMLCSILAPASSVTARSYLTASSAAPHGTAESEECTNEATCCYDDTPAVFLSSPGSRPMSCRACAIVYLQECHFLVVACNTCGAQHATAGPNDHFNRIGVLASLRTQLCRTHADEPHHGGANTRRAEGRRRPQLLLRRRGLQGSHACLGCGGHHLAPGCRVRRRPRLLAAPGASSRLAAT